MKVLLVNGSPHKEGCVFTALTEIAETLKGEGIDSSIFWIGSAPVQGCTACFGCRQGDEGCVFQDEIYTSLVKEIKGSDGIIIGSPVYYAGPNGSLCALLDRLFYSAGMLLSYKPAAAVAVCRRGGASACFDRLNKYFTINNMPVVSSQYWNSVHGWEKGEAEQDAEGLQTMRTLARNMAWMMRNLTKEQRPESEKPKLRTNFIG